MKLNENLQDSVGNDNTDVAKVAKRATKLSPIKKDSKRTIYNDLDEEEDYELSNYKKRDSILDYYDDVDEDEEGEEGDEEYDDDDEEDYDEEEDYDDNDE